MHKRTQQRKNGARRRTNSSVAKIITGIEGFDRICQISGLERYRGSLKGEKPTHFVSEGGHREARIRALAAPEP